MAWAAELYSVPYFALKVVTDIGKRALDSAVFLSLARIRVNTVCGKGEKALFDVCGTRTLIAFDMHYFSFLRPLPAVDGAHATEEEFVANFAMAQRRLQEAVPATLDYVLGRSLEEL